MTARQRTLPHVDTSARAQGRRERGPLARRRWREFGWLTRTVIESANARELAAWPWHDPPAPLTAWHVFCELGISRRWWTVTDVRCLLRPFQLQCLRVPELRCEHCGHPMARHATPGSECSVAGCDCDLVELALGLGGHREPCCQGARNRRPTHDPDCGSEWCPRCWIQKSQSSYPATDSSDPNCVLCFICCICEGHRV
jgi:hypothetical protein